MAGTLVLFRKNSLTEQFYGFPFQRMIEHSPEGFVLLNSQARLLYVNPVVGRMYDSSVEDLLGTSVFGWIHPGDLEIVRNIYRQLVTEPGSSRAGVFRLLQSHDSIHWVEASGVNMLDDPDVNGIVVMFHDITARKKHETKIRSLLSTLEHSNEELSRAYEAAIEGWSRALDLRDHQTEDHALRVTELTVRLARSLGLSEEQITHVRRGALLHDIGKLGIPDGILNKPAALTEAEWTIMRRHPVHAYEMLQALDFLGPALDIPRYHHEKWDGSGYPRGLAGERIPMAARLFAVVDVYDALTSDRPYRKAWKKEKALGYIQDHIGSQFDPRIAAVFLQIIQKLPG